MLLVGVGDAALLMLDGIEAHTLLFSETQVVPILEARKPQKNILPPLVHDASFASCYAASCPFFLLPSLQTTTAFYKCGIEQLGQA